MEDDLGVVAFACETVARKVVASQITDALEAGPFDAKQAARLRELMERLAWAIDAAVEVNAGYFPEPETEEVA